ncbi:hypothetical protein IZ6_12970 [Terrihabitans soli]|uniref:Uncharacterized protein n=1 Tax=Terrihabitans soli TaxID=708113 RepID=A0A6S6QTG4_9HYPH|nr:hypothetical protein [Terrihabitans soli]BCJ90562.1 hypothetical protein IZ6_12970 [Terrihabitans soli]
MHPTRFSAGIFAAIAFAAIALSPAKAGSMTFKPMDVGGKKILLAEGEITENSDAAFRRALRRGGQGRVGCCIRPAAIFWAA